MSSPVWSGPAWSSPSSVRSGVVCSMRLLVFKRIFPGERGSKPSLISETNTNFTQFSPIGDYFLYVRVCVCVCRELMLCMLLTHTHTDFPFAVRVACYFPKQINPANATVMSVNICAPT